MRYRILGKTGLEVSEVGFGGIPIIRVGTREAVKIVKRAYDKGVTFFDTANAYRDSEEKMGLAFKGIRDKVVIATKTQKRDAESAMVHIENSLTKLQTDYIDLYQFHQVSHDKDWDAIMAPSGAMEAVKKAQEQGKIRHIGITSHSLTMAIKLVKAGLFSTIQFPFNFIEKDARDELHAIADEMNIGILAMKPFAGGMIDNANIAFKFLRQFPSVLPIPGFHSEDSIDEILGFYDEPNVVTEEDLALMDKYRDELGRQFCRRCEYCQPCPSGVMITPAMGYRVMSVRMSPRVAAENLKTVMETVPKCVECGLCIKRCPYNLPIPEMLRKHYDMFEEHRSNDNF